MISKSEIKLIRGLKSKKNRDKSHLFVAEGVKLVEHLVNSGLNCKFLFALEGLTSDVSQEVKEVSSAEMKQISFLDSPSPMLAVFHKPAITFASKSNQILALDDVRDPGNMGTILRLADWFGVNTVLCSRECVDIYNPKVIQSTMGSIANLEIVSGDLKKLLLDYGQRDYHLLGAEMEGTPMQQYKSKAKTVLVMGNEANGISSDIQEVLDESITIEKASTASAESLNVGTATGILLGNLFKA